MAKKSTPATTDYVNHAVAQAVNPIEERVARLEETSRPDSGTPSSERVTETMTPSCVYQKHEVSIDLDDNPEGIMSDEDYLFQVYPDLPRWLTKTPEQHLKMVTDLYRDKAIGQLCVEEVRRIMTNYFPSIQPQIKNLISVEAQLYTKETLADTKIVVRELTLVDDRIKKLAERDDDFKSRLDDLENQRKEFKADYDRVIRLDQFERRNTGLFVRGKRWSSAWFIAVTIFLLITFNIIGGYFILSQQEQIGHQKSQIEYLLQRVSKHQTPFNHPQRGAQNQHPFRKD